MKPLFFILGTARSGTTLLEQCLNRHTDIFVPPETFFFSLLDNLVTDMSKSVSGDELRHFVEHWVSSKALRFLALDKQFLREILLDNANVYQDLLNNLLIYLSRDSGANTLGEKTPRHLRHAEMIRQMFPDARFIFLVRDPRAVVQSHLKHPNWRHSVASAAHKWSRDQYQMQRLMQKWPQECWTLLRYEDLVQNSDVSFKRVLNFLQLDFQALDKPLDHTDVDPFNEYYAQSWMKKSQQAIDGRGLDDWKKACHKADIYLMEMTLGEQLVQMGYEPMGQATDMTVKAYLREYFLQLKRGLFKRLPRWLERF